MFNGIVEAVGKITCLKNALGSKEFIISVPKAFDDLFVGASVAVNGVCLTITHFTHDDFAVTAVPETLRLTNLNDVKQNCLVNLERPLKAGGRIGGHYVQGHVDAVGEIIAIKPDGDAQLVEIRIPGHLTKFIVKKGYVGIDGMSITVVNVDKDSFTVTLIPQTRAMTIAHQYRVGSRINIEVDILGKYVEKLLGAHTSCNPI